jgi:hypothetical protein
MRKYKYVPVSKKCLNKSEQLFRKNNLRILQTNVNPCLYSVKRWPCSSEVVVVVS